MFLKGINKHMERNKNITSSNTNKLQFCWGGFSQATAAFLGGITVI